MLVRGACWFQGSLPCALRMQYRGAQPAGKISVSKACTYNNTGTGAGPRFKGEGRAAPYVDVHRRREHMSLLMTGVLGIVGSFAGGFIARLFSKPPEGTPIHPAGILMSIVGAVLVLFVWNSVVGGVNEPPAVTSIPGRGRRLAG